MFVFLSIFLLAVVAQLPYKCRFSLQQSNGVSVTGQLTYDYASGRMERKVLDNNQQAVVTDFYQYDPFTKAGQQVQTTHQSNSKCSENPISQAMPVLDFTSPLVTIDGQQYTLSECEATSSLPAPVTHAYGEPCPACEVPLDIVFAVDTSLSVCQTSSLLSQTVKDLTSSYNLGPNAVRVGIVRFAWRSWVSSHLNVGNSIQEVNFPNKWPARCGTPKSCPGPECCKNGDNDENDCLGTCVSCGVRLAADLLEKEGRRGVASAIIVVTDGYHNKKYIATDDKDGAHSTYRGNGCAAKEKGEHCHPEMIADMEDARRIARSKVPGVEIFSYGQYKQKRAPELKFLNATVTNDKNVFISTEGWSALSAQTTVLAQIVCGSRQTTCDNCRGFCSLGKCLSLAGPRPINPAPSGGPYYSANEAQSATDTTIVGEDGSGTTIVTTSDNAIPGWGVALLALVSVLIVLVIINLAMKITSPGSERV